MLSSFVSASFVFRTDDGKAGETCQAQLSITSTAFPGSPAVVLRGLRVEFDGSLRTIVLEHEPSGTQGAAKDTVVFSVVTLTEDSPPDGESVAEEALLLHGNADLALMPGQTRVYEMAIPLREPGDAQASSLTLSLQTDAFALDYTMGFRDTSTPDVWFGLSARKRRIARMNAHIIHVEPRPPKMEIHLVKPLEQYYANEPIQLHLRVVNAEESDATTKMEVHFFGVDNPEV